MHGTAIPSSRFGRGNASHEADQAKGYPSGNPSSLCAPLFWAALPSRHAHSRRRKIDSARRRVPQSQDRRFPGWLLLAPMPHPRALPPLKHRLLAREARSKQQPRSSQRRSPCRRRVGCHPSVGARGCGRRGGAGRAQRSSGTPQIDARVLRVRLRSWTGDAEWLGGVQGEPTCSSRPAIMNSIGLSSRAGRETRGAQPRKRADGASAHQCLGRRARGRRDTD